TSPVIELVIPPLEWHKSRVEWAQQKFKVSDYGIFWVGFGEGVLLGALGVLAITIFMKSLV
ncbi:MAG TPA: hypothetical protein ACN46W_04465, partial [Prochlorococcus sp.]